MGSTRVLLLEGFENDEVVITIDGVEAERRSAVTTSLLLGLAAEVTLTVADDATELVVAVPSKGTSARVVLPGGDATFLVNLEGGAVELVQGTGREGVM